MDTDRRIHQLIFAYLSKTISAEELDTLEKWVAECVEHRVLFDELCNQQLLKEDLQLYASFDTEEQWRILRSRSVGLRPAFYRQRKTWMSAAAVVLLLIGLGFMYFFRSSGEIPGEPLAENVIQPGKTQAVLLWGNGQKVNLGDLKDTCFMLGQQEEVKIGEHGELSYMSASLPEDAEIHTLQVPRGGEYKLMLSDGTKVWLNSASALSYPVHFTGGVRRVTLTGEAYFQVSRDAAHPFIVETQGMNIQVLGTSFNVMNYPEETHHMVTLVEGQVKVFVADPAEGCVLKPGEQAVVENAMTRVRKVNTKLYTLWWQDRFSFESEELEAVVRKLARWYDVEFFFVNPARKEKRFTGSIPKYSDISQVLAMIRMTTDIGFTIQGKTVLVQ